MKSKWWEEKAIELLMAADRKNMKSFYIGLKKLFIWSQIKRNVSTP